jgi:hypothetical protein
LACSSSRWGIASNTLSATAAEAAKAARHSTAIWNDRRRRRGGFVAPAVPEGVSLAVGMTDEEFVGMGRGMITERGKAEEDGEDGGRKSNPAVRIKSFLD